MLGFNKTKQLQLLIEAEKAQAQRIKAEAESIYQRLYQLAGIVYMNDTPSDYINQGYTLNADVYSIVSRIAAKASEAEWVLYKAKDMQNRKDIFDSPKRLKKAISRKEIEVVDNSDIYKLLYNPNPHMTLSQFVEACVGFRLLIGNNYILKWGPENGTNKGKIVRLEVLPAHFISIELNEAGIKSYNLNIGKLNQFPAESVIHTRTFNPDFSVYGSSLYGQSPMRAGRMLVTKSNDSFKAAMRIIQNGGATGILSSEKIGQADSQQVPDTDLVKRLQEDLEKNYSGPNNWGKRIVSGHPWRWIQLGMSAVDMALIESQKLNTDQICNLYKFPPELLGSKDAAKYNSMKEAKKAMVSDCVLPELRELRDSLNKGLIEQIDPTLYLDFEVDHFAELQEDLELMSRRMSAEWWWTPNEKREMTGKEPLQAPGMNEIWRPMAIEPLNGEPDIDQVGDNLRASGIDEAYN